MEGDCDSRYCRFLCRVQKFTSTIGILRTYTPHGVYCDIHCGGRIPMNWNYSLDWAGRGNNDANDDAEDHRP
mgnify:CR=1 FL=1